MSGEKSSSEALGTKTEPLADRAVRSLGESQPERALQVAAALLDPSKPSPLGLLVCGKALLDLGDKPLGKQVLELSIRAATTTSRLPLGAVALLWLDAAGEQTVELRRQLASVFGRGSRALISKAAMPPVLHREEPAAWPEQGAKLLERVKQLVEKLDAASLTEPEPHEVAPQPLFSALDPESLEALLTVLQVRIAAAGEVVLRQGEMGQEAMICARGDFRVERRSQENTVALARLGAGAVFGEMALLSRAPRAASVVALRPSLLLVAERAALDELAAKQPRVGAELAAYCHRRMMENLVRASSLLAAVKQEERPALMERFVTRAFEPGDHLIVQGEESEGLHLIASGEVRVVHREGEECLEIARLGVGEVVGEVSLVLRRPSTADVVAEQPTITLHLHRDQFLDLIRKHPTLLAQLYELAVKRHEETSSIVAQEAAAADDAVIM